MLTPDFADVRGQADAIRACEDVARAHVTGRAPALLLTGAPGTGRTMLARRIPTILPPLDDHARRWLAVEYEAWGRPPDVIERPFRAPHFSVGVRALAGEGLPYAYLAGRWRSTLACSCMARNPSANPLTRPAHLWHNLPSGPVGRAGEAELARFGVLFLDDLIEFQRSAIVALVERLARMAPHTRPLIVASAMPCPCGRFGLGDGLLCRCTPDQIKRTRERVESYLALFAELVTWRRADLPVQSLADLRAGTPGDSSATIRARVVA